MQNLNEAFMALVPPNRITTAAQQHRQQTTIHALPQELELHIIAFLRLRDLVSLSLTCKYFHSLLRPISPSLRAAASVDEKRATLVILQRAGLAPHDTLACGRCFRFRHPSAFTCDQRDPNPKSAYRHCYDCGLRLGKHKPGMTVAMGWHSDPDDELNGKLGYICPQCMQVRMDEPFWRCGRCFRCCYCSAVAADRLPAPPASHPDHSTTQHPFIIVDDIPGELQDLNTHGPCGTFSAERCPPCARIAKQTCEIHDPTQWDPVNETLYQCVCKTKCAPPLSRESNSLHLLQIYRADHWRPVAMPWDYEERMRSEQRGL